MPYYTAFTLGPIVRTLENARHTRELWGASYMLSYLMKRFVNALKEDPDQDPKRSFYLPFVDTDNEMGLFLDKEKTENGVTRTPLQIGAGLFPDRFFYRTEQPEDLNACKKILLKELNAFCVDVAEHIRRSGELTKVQSYFQQYLQTHILSMELEEEGEPEDINPILAMSPYLDSLELQHYFPARDRDYLTRLLSWVSDSFLTKDAFGQAKYFDTLFQVASREFEGQRFYTHLLDQEKEAREEMKKIAKAIAQGGNDSVEEAYDKEEEEEQLSELIRKLNEAEQKLDENLYDKLEEFAKDTFRTCHKYVAIVQADGDNISKQIKALESKQSEYQDFSKKLLDTGISSVEKIKTYGGIPVYAGGDDLLFFAPVVNGERHILGLLDELNNNFKKAFGFLDGQQGDYDGPTLSFGLSISYYKYPLYESLQEAIKLLFVEAKKHSIQLPGKKLEKNTIAFRVLKHSGSHYGAKLHMQGPVYKAMKEMLDSQGIIKGGSEQGENLQPVSSVAFKLNDPINQALLRQIATQEERMDAFMTNNFNEPVHREEPFASYLKRSQELIHAIAEETAGIPRKEDEPHPFETQRYALMRLLSFILENPEA